MQLVIGVEATAAEHLLDSIADRLDRPGPVLELVGEAMVEYEADVFATSGHGAWAPLDPATIAAKGSSRILVDTGGLLDALTSRANVDGESVTLDGTPYARFLKAGARGAPPRDPAPEPDHSTVERWADQVLGFLVDGRRL